MVSSKGRGPKKQLERFRSKIDEVDDKILKLLNRRAGLVQKVGNVKNRLGKGSPARKVLYRPEREKSILRRLTKSNSGPFPAPSVVPVFTEIISACRSLEIGLQIAYLGPEATFTHQAAQKHFGHHAYYHPMRTIHEIFNAVERGLCDHGLAPIENSTGGTVGETLDCFVDSDLQITGEVQLRISYNLYSKAGKIEKVRRIYSHPQAIAQSWGWIRSHLPDAEIMEVSSTAEAARKAKSDDTSAAITGKPAGQMYGLKPLAECIEDYHENFTRFLVIGRDSTHPTGEDRTSLLLSLKDEPGILFKALEPFARKGLNMSKIESRPLKQKAWEYLFFIDVDGHQEDSTIKEAIKEVKTYCLFLKVLGSYPRD